MKASRYRGLIACLLTITLPVFSQRTYQSSSVLSTGDCYKLSVSAAGLYRIDVPLLKKLGISGNAISSASLRLFGTGGAMLNEKIAGNYIDDLPEVALLVNDGGDGIFNGDDYALFFAPGPDRWTADTVNRTYSHTQNLYSRQSYYFFSIGGTGKRMLTDNTPVPTGAAITTFDEHQFLENDTINFLASGKNWYGIEFSSQVAGGLSRSFKLATTNATTGAGIFRAAVIARSQNGPGIFSASVNGASPANVVIPLVTSSNFDIYARSGIVTTSFQSNTSSTATITYQPANAGGQGWLDWYEYIFPAQLSMKAADQLMFRSWSTVGASPGGIYSIADASAATTVLDISNPLAPVLVNTRLSGTTLSLPVRNESLHEYIAFNKPLSTPAIIGKIPTQNLHGLATPDLLIVTTPALTSSASRLAGWHEIQDGLKVSTVMTDAIYNEFGSGSPDPAAIRNFIKMLYDRGGLRYVLLLGDASFDYLNHNANSVAGVPAFESRESLDPLATFASDDFFALLKDSADINLNNAYNDLVIGVGRIPAGTAQQAQSFVDKLTHYHDSASMGAWRNELSFVADDEDANLHLDDAEATTAATANTNRNFHIRKTYLDAFHQESTTAGSRYPDVNKEISDEMQRGTLIWNYNGHGGFRRLAEEVVLDDGLAATWQNQDHLPLLITATCDFAPYDNPQNFSLGENLLLRPNNGAIALMTTTRLVFAFSNRIMNETYLETAFRRKADSSYLSLGEAMRDAKNATAKTSADITNNRKFTLLGDPAMTLAFPKASVVTDVINNIPGGSFNDTLRSLKVYQASGSVRDNHGSILTDFNGVVNVTVYDKPVSQQTLANDITSFPSVFKQESSRIYNGTATVINGKFNYRFIVPADINYQAGTGRIQYYAASKIMDANGSTPLTIGGSGPGSVDKTGPEIKAFLNSRSFINGQTVGASPTLIVDLADSSGFNLTGELFGHDMIAILDSDINHPISLNNFFVATGGNYTRGEIRYLLQDVSEGRHRLKIKCWDAANNASEVVIDFNVSRKETFILQRIHNDPNPFTGETTFCIEFENAEIGKDVDVWVRIFDLSGRLMKTLKNTINLTGNRSCDIVWNGSSAGGVRVTKGIYVYTVDVRTPSRNHLTKAERLFVQ